MCNREQPKIIIVGAGLIGTSIALCLEHQPVNIEILESNLSTISSSAKTDMRPISLSYGSHLTLKKLGIWNQLSEQACPIKAVHVSELGRFGITRITAKEQQVPALGFVVPFGKLQAAIYEKAVSLTNVTFTAIQKINAINTNKTTEILVDNAIQKTADLFIAADGTNSTCRQLLNIATTKENHADCAQIFQLDLSIPHDFTAYERFTKKGVLAILPLHNQNKARLVWSMSLSTQNEIDSWNTHQLLSFLQSVFKGRLSINKAEKSAKFPLQTVLAETQIANGAVLMGNAAHTIYPVAAQGFNLGLADVSALQKVLIDAIKNGQPIGSKSVLKNYVERATPHQQTIIKLTNKLTPLFELQLPFAGCARGIGLLGMDLITPLKNKLAKRAMGIT